MSKAPPAGEGGRGQIWHDRLQLRSHRTCDKKQWRKTGRKMADALGLTSDVIAGGVDGLLVLAREAQTRRIYSGSRCIYSLGSEPCK